MVANPEICRANGRKSRGPVSERGKALASNNATKHGLLSERPPLILGEDLETFQGLLQGLVDYYQPESPVEWHLVQQVAMAMLRQHRIWAAEASHARAEMTPSQLLPYTDSKYPERIHEDAEAVIELRQGEKTEWHPENRKQEREILLEVLEKVVGYFFELPRPKAKYFNEALADWKSSALYILEKAESRYPCKTPSKNTVFLGEQIFLMALQKIEEKEKEKKSAYYFIKITKSSFEASLGTPSKVWLEQLRSACQRRLDELDSVEAEIQQAHQEYQRQCSSREQVTMASKAIPERIELLTRYERHVNKQLHLALDRLQAIKQQR